MPDKKGREWTISVPSSSAFVAPGAAQAIERQLAKKFAERVAVELFGPTPPMLKAALLAYDVYTLVDGTTEGIQAPIALPNGAFAKCGYRTCPMPTSGFGWLIADGVCGPSCLDNQAIVGASSGVTIGTWYETLDPSLGLGHRGSLADSWTSVDGLAHPVAPAPALYRGHGTTLKELADPGVALDPNLMRAGLKRSLRPDLNEIPVPVDDPAPLPRTWVDVPSPMEIPNVTEAPSVDTRFTVRPERASEGTGTSPQPGTNPVPGDAPDPKAYSGGAGGVVQRPISRPRFKARRTREPPKHRSRGLNPFRIMDIASEVGDAVGAIYKALPKEVQKKWDKKQLKGEPVPRNFGQYGIGGLDYQAAAIWHNWDKIDVPQAIANLLANEAEDQLLGRTAAQLPPGAMGHYFKVLGAQKDYERSRRDKQG